MLTFPVELVLRDREALVIGTGPETLPKIERLIEAGARVTAITEGEAGAEIEALAARGAITLHTREAADADLEGKAIVFAAPFTTPEGEARAKRWHAEAIRKGTLFCAIDRPEACTFTSSAIVRASGITMTFSTGGTSPGAARRIREDLAALFATPRFAGFMAALAELRRKLPRGERAPRMAAAVRGFAIEATLRFPEWFDRGEDAPPGD
jgi:precorrin-2 dehydrogenase/sirohydrochlorin ferrochelatase